MNNTFFISLTSTILLNITTTALAMDTKYPTTPKTINPSMQIDFSNMTHQFYVSDALLMMAGLTESQTIQNLCQENELYQSIKNQKTDKAQSLLEKKINPNLKYQNTSTPLIAAIKNKSLADVELLLKHGANPRIYVIKGNNKRFYPEDALELSCQSPCPETANFIKPSDVSIKKNNEIHAALLCKRLEQLSSINK